MEQKWKIVAELDSNTSNFSTCILKAPTEEKALSMAKKYFIKKMKATNVTIISINKIKGE